MMLKNFFNILLGTEKRKVRKATEEFFLNWEKLDDTRRKLGAELDDFAIAVGQRLGEDCHIDAQFLCWEEINMNIDMYSKFEQVCTFFFQYFEIIGNEDRVFFLEKLSDISKEILGQTSNISLLQQKKLAAFFEQRNQQN